MATSAAKLYHISLFSLYLLVTYILQVENMKKKDTVEDPTLKFMLSFSKRFLTNWTYTVQLIYLMLCLVSYILSVCSTKAAEKVTSLSDYIFVSIATPMAFSVSIMFWALYAVSRELVYPKVLDLIIPVWVNHCIHTFNSMFAILDIFLINHKFPNFKTAIKGLLIYMVLYAFCLFGTYFYDGVWLYPVLKEIDWPMRVVFALGNLTLGTLMYFTTQQVHKCFWGNVLPEKSKKSGKQKKK